MLRKAYMEPARNRSDALGIARNRSESLKISEPLPPIAAVCATPPRLNIYYD